VEHVPHVRVPERAALEFLGGDVNAFIP
jgi:hypothetical protein